MQAFPEDVERYEDDVRRAVKECQKRCRIERGWEGERRDWQRGAGPQERGGLCGVRRGDGCVLEGVGVRIWERR